MALRYIFVKGNPHKSHRKVAEKSQSLSKHLQTYLALPESCLHREFELILDKCSGSTSEKMIHVQLVAAGRDVSENIFDGLLRNCGT